MKARFVVSALLNALIISFISNSFVLIKLLPHSLFTIVPLFVFVNIFAGMLIPYDSYKRFMICQHGTVLLYSFYASVILSSVYHIFLAVNTLPAGYTTLIWSAAVCFGVNFLVFWNGMICVYVTSVQLGLKWRIMGIICGMIPFANLVALFFILRITTAECLFEIKKHKINEKRKNEKICATKYPILMVHGVFFRDTRFFNYWGRIPKELETNGAKIFYGNHSSAAFIADSALELKERITEILEKTGAEKVNIIAHSKGGLDCRYAISKLGIGNCVASLTTVNTPHKGCLFADHLLTKTPEKIKNNVADTYNSALKRFGDARPDFIAAVSDLTNANCSRLNTELQTPKEIYCQSVGSVLTKATNGKFPLNFSYNLVKHFSGENDGLVSEEAFEWGEKYTLLKPPKKRGISHGDMIDLNRENIKGFDVREFYVELVSDLKNRGL